MIRSVVTLLALSPFLMAEAPSEAKIRDAASRAIGILERSNKTWFEKQQCASCHHQAYSLVAFHMAAQRNVPVNREIAAMATAKTFAFGQMGGLDGALQGSHLIDPALAEPTFAFTAAELGVPRNPGTSALARMVAGLQHEDGRWVSFDARPPQMYGSFSATALSMRTLQNYASPRVKADTDERVRRAAEWLRTHEPDSTEDAVYRLMGLAWAGAPADSALASVRKLQHPDGGWGEAPGYLSDAYSTGEALYALYTAGVPVTDGAYSRGLKFLISSQYQDGSWLVRSRMNGPAPVSPPYFETGFPFGKDQAVSANATGWAAIALMLALPKVTEAAVAPPQNGPEWMETAMFGTAAELKAALDGGLDPNQATANGTSLLMLAVPDPEKTRLLLDRGASASARAKSGYNALMVAARFRGSAPILKLLMDRGAEVDTPKGKPALFGASALYWTAFSGDVEAARLLLDRGARLNGRVSLGGLLAPWTPIQIATMMDNAAMVSLLAERGANVNEGDSFSVTPLSRAVLRNSVEVARVLIGKGAKVNQVDQLGMTPLLYAATRDFGDTKMAELLLASGADRKLKSKDGKTAVDLARLSGHLPVSQLLKN